MLTQDRVKIKDYIKQLNIALDQANDIIVKLTEENKKLQSSLTELKTEVEYKKHICKICGMPHYSANKSFDHSFSHIVLE